MAIGTALNTSLSGLKNSQLGLEIAANNIANAGSTGYSRRTSVSTAQVIGDRTYGVNPGRVQREIDIQVQRQWRTSTANATYAQTKADSLDRLDAYYGGPSDPTSLDSIFNGFKKAFETLAASPENGSARIDAVSAANTLATRIRTLSDDIQALRQEAESGIGSAVTEVNELLRQISVVDKQIVSVGVNGSSTAGLEDERDAAIDRLSELIDVRVEEQDYGAISIFTTNGTLLYDDEAVQLAFDERGTLTAASKYSADPALRTVGTLRIASGPGAGLDLFRDGGFDSGKIAALKELRDETLVQAQSQLDTLAAQMSQALSNRTEAGTATAGGYDLDLTGLIAGNTVTLDYTDIGGSHRVTFVAHDGTATVGDKYTADPTDTVVGLDLSGASGSIADQIAGALGAGFSVSDLGGGQVRVIDDGGGTKTVSAFSASITADGLTSGDPAFALFIDQQTGLPFTGLSGDKAQLDGFAARITLNPAVKADPASLVLYGSGVEPSDTSRPRQILDALTSDRFIYSAASGIGSTSAPFSGTVEQFLKQVISTQGAAADQARQVAEGQAIVTANLTERYDGSREVDIDTELAALIELQTAYQANARVMTAAREMLETLMNVL